MLNSSGYGVIRLGVEIVIGLEIEGIKDRLSRLRFVSENDMVGIDNKKRTCSTPIPSMHVSPFAILPQACLDRRY